MPEGRCHCGNIRFRVEQPPVSLTRCNCSICHRYGTLWAYYTPEQVSIEEETPSIAYSWDEHSIAFHHCPVCGCLTHYQTINRHAGERTVINARMLPPEQISDLPVRRFDGAESWKFLD